jgi:hypothetical protein
MSKIMKMKEKLTKNFNCELLLNSEDTLSQTHSFFRFQLTAFQLNVKFLGYATFPTAKTTRFESNVPDRIHNFFVCTQSTLFGIELAFQHFLCSEFPFWNEFFSTYFCLLNGALSTKDPTINVTVFCLFFFYRSTWTLLSDGSPAKRFL